MILSVAQSVKLQTSNLKNSDHFLRIFNSIGHFGAWTNSLNFKLCCRILDNAISGKFKGWSIGWVRFWGEILNKKNTKTRWKKPHKMLWPVKTSFNQGGHIFIFIFGKVQNDQNDDHSYGQRFPHLLLQTKFSDNFHPLEGFRWEIRCWNKNLQNPNLRMNFMVMQLRCGDGNLISPCYCCNFFGKISPSCVREKKIPSVGETQNASNIEFKVANRTPKYPPILPHLHHLQLAVF